MITFATGVIGTGLVRLSLERLGVANGHTSGALGWMPAISFERC